MAVPRWSARVKSGAGSPSLGTSPAEPVSNANTHRTNIMSTTLSRSLGLRLCQEVYVMGAFVARQPTTHDYRPSADVRASVFLDAKRRCALRAHRSAAALPSLSAAGSLSQITRASPAAVLPRKPARRSRGGLLGVLGSTPNGGFITNRVTRHGLPGH